MGTIKIIIKQTVFNRKKKKKTLFLKKKKKKKKDWRFNFKVRFSDKKKPRKSRVYFIKKESLDLGEEYNDIYINSNNKTAYYINIE